MIHLDSKSSIAPDEFTRSIWGWYSGECVPSVISIRSGSFSVTCTLEARPDVEAAYPDGHSTGFRAYLDFLSSPAALKISDQGLEIEVDSGIGEIQRFTIPVQDGWEDDLKRMRAAGATPAEHFGVGTPTGGGHHRAYVGFAEEYDLSGASAFQLLVLLGLRQYHRLLDIGCGSLRCGRLFIPYLNPGNYLGVEPNRWLVEEGVSQELGESILSVKRPEFVFTSEPSELTAAKCSNFAVANSIFSHASIEQIRGWLALAALNLCHGGALIATYVEGDSDYAGGEWVYPGCVAYRRTTMKELAAEQGLAFRVLDWRHLHGQTWALFGRPGFDFARVERSPICWNYATNNR